MTTLEIILIIACLLLSIIACFFYKKSSEADNYSNWMLSRWDAELDKKNNFIKLVKYFANYSKSKHSKATAKCKELANKIKELESKETLCLQNSKKK